MPEISDYCQTNPQLKRLLAGDVPDEEWSFAKLSASSVEKRIEQWSFVGRWFRRGAANVACRPAIMPVLAWLTLQTGIVPSLDMLVDFLRCSPIACGPLEARAYQCYTAWLRECKVALYLRERGLVLKNPWRDIAEGVDLTFEGHDIAIAHAGDRYLPRKRNCATVLYATGTDGVHLVVEADIEAIICNILASSSSA